MPKLSASFISGITLVVVGIVLAVVHWLLVSVGKEMPSDVSYLMHSAQALIGVGVLAFGVDSYKVHSKNGNGNGSSK